MEYAYNDASRMLSLIHKRSGTNFADFAYAYNSVGNRTNRVETNNGTPVTDVYGYDATDQVTSVNYNTGTRTVSYQWDAVGNRISVTNNGTGTSYTANSLNQYTAVGGDSPTHDSKGNLITQNGWTYTFDGQNRLLTATNNNNTSSFSYDSLNRCVSRTINGTTTLLIYDGWSLIEEWTSGGAQVAHYVHGPRIDELLVKVSTTNAVYYHHDGLGSVTHLTGTNGAVVEKYTYDIFGAATIKDGNGNTIGATTYANRFLFTGREWLAEISLYDYRNRVYSPDLGRFLQTDPIRFSAGDVNLYRYVGNNPMNFIDPDGRFTNPSQANPNPCWISNASGHVTVKIDCDPTPVKHPTLDCWQTPEQFYCGKLTGADKVACENSLKGLFKYSWANKLKCQALLHDCRLCCALTYTDNPNDPKGNKQKTCEGYCAAKAQACLLL